MSDMAYIMETQDPHELWLVEGESKFKVSRDMYWLLVSQGADLPRAHDISDLLAENAALRQQLADVTESMGRVEERCAKLRELVGRMAKALRVGSGWCNRDCADEFGCDLHGCPIEASMRDLGIEVDDWANDQATE